MRPYIHMLLHFAVPAAIAWSFYRERFVQATLIMWGTMLVDLDHLLADPVYDPGRCSIGFHPLHQYPAIVAYAAATLWERTRLLGIGLLIHMVLDGVDCFWMHHER